MTDRLFNAPGANHGTAAEQLRNLLAMRARPGAAPAVEDAAAAALVEAEPAVAAAAPELAGNAAVPTGLADDAAHAAAAGGIAGHDIDSLARAAQEAAMRGALDPAAQQFVDVQVQPRLIIQGQRGPIVIPVDVAVPAAQARVNIATPITMLVDPVTGQAVPAGAAAGGAVAEAAAPAAAAEAGGLGGIRSMNAEQFGALFRRGGGAAPAAAPEAVAEAAGAAGAGRPSLLEQLRGAGEALHGAPAAEAAAVPVAEAAAPAARGGLLDGFLSRRAAAAGAEVADVATPAAANRGANLLGDLRAGLGVMAGRAEGAAAPGAAEVVEAAAKANLVEDLLRAASRISPRG
ncbi:MAG: hypothetical protein JWM86_1476 [Thermoleophilia bacterium]|nr:hypothetical protein [Thermoleophilia bacterium]